MVPPIIQIDFLFLLNVGPNIIEIILKTQDQFGQFLPLRMF